MQRTLALLLACALLGACGSTVSRRQQATRAQQGGGEFGAAAPGDTATSLLDNGAPAPSVTTGHGSSARPGGRGTTAATTPGTFGPGVTADSIYIGLSYATNNAANGAIGAPGLTQGDPKAQDQAMMDDINAHGGIAGRKLVGVFHPVDPNSSSPWDVIDQQSCDDWTQDHKIFAALAEPLADSDTMASCLDKRGVALITTALSTSDAARFRRLPAYVELTSMGLDRIAQAEVDALQAQNWFSGWDNVNGVPAQTKAKVGIVTFEGAAWSHAVDQVMVPALRALGHAPSPDDIIRVTPEHATQDISSTGAATSSTRQATLGPRPRRSSCASRRRSIRRRWTRTRRRCSIKPASSRRSTSRWSAATRTSSSSRSPISCCRRSTPRPGASSCGRTSNSTTASRWMRKLQNSPSSAT